MASLLLQKANNVFSPLATLLAHPFTQIISVHLVLIRLVPRIVRRQTQEGGQRAEGGGLVGGVCIYPMIIYDN